MAKESNMVKVIFRNKIVFNIIFKLNYDITLESKL